VVTVYLLSLVIFNLMTSMVEMKLNKILSFSSFSYTVLAELGFKQEVKRIRANVSY